MIHLTFPLKKNCGVFKPGHFFAFPQVVYKPARGQYPWHQVFFRSLSNNIIGNVMQMIANREKCIFTKPSKKKEIVIKNKYL